MSEQYYALSGIEARLNEDGTSALIQLDLAGCQPAQFVVDLEGLNKLSTMFQAVSLEMTARQEAGRTVDKDGSQ